MIPPETTIAIVEGEELQAVLAWAHDTRVKVSWDSSILQLRVVFTQPETRDLFYLRGLLDGYKAIPPAWDFCDEQWDDAGKKKHYPAPPALPLPGNIKSTVFHTNPVICAPFNRLAYQDHGGPHGDWGGASNWLQFTGKAARADTMADMLAVIHRDLCYSRGRMS